MSNIPEKRRELRALARERYDTSIPRLKGAVKDARAHKRATLTKIRQNCKNRRAELVRDADKARAQLRARIKAARVKAQKVCKACKVSATERELDHIDKAIAKLHEEREAISELRARANRMKSEHGRAGGIRAAELRAESDDLVRNNLGDDPTLLAVWERRKHKTRATKGMSRTEAFLHYVHDHPQELYEQMARDEDRWQREADALLGQMKPPAGFKADRDFDDYMARLDAADQMYESAPGAVPF